MEGVDYGYLQTKRLGHSIAQSEAYICTDAVCGFRVWAYREYPNRPAWTKDYRGCFKHAREYEVPGSIMDDLWYEDDLKDFPPALMKREAELHLQQVTRENLRGATTGEAAGSDGG